MKETKDSQRDCRSLLTQAIWNRILIRSAINEPIHREDIEIVVAYFAASFDVAIDRLRLRVFDDDSRRDGLQEAIDILETTIRVAVSQMKQAGIRLDKDRALLKDEPKA